MANYKTHLDVKPRYMLGLTFLLLITIICAALGFTRDDDFSMAKQQILLRNIGHEILLHSGDSTSRVLPVKEIALPQVQTSKYIETVARNSDVAPTELEVA